MTVGRDALDGRVGSAGRVAPRDAVDPVPATSESRRRLAALAGMIPADAKIPAGGVERARRLFGATSPALSDAERVEYITAVGRLIDGEVQIP